jgi:hypothetical protein
MKTILKERFPAISTNLILAAVLVFCFSISAFAQDYATIYIYRQKKFTSSGIDYKIYLNGLEIAQVANGGRLEYRCYKEGRASIKVGIFSEYGLKSDNYDNNLTVELKKGQSYYFQGEGKSFRQMPNETGKAEFERSSDFKGEVNFIDDKPFDYASLNKEVKPAEPEPQKPAETVAPPEIIISSPKIGTGDFHATAEAIKLAGYVDSKSNVKSISINGEAVPTDEVGNFSLQLKLKEGLNKVTIVTENEGGQTATKAFRIIRDAAEENAIANNQSGSQEEITYRGSDPFKGTNVANVAKEIRTGKYYALFIGIDNYSGSWTPLKNAVNDGKAIESLLQTQYRFDVVKTLYNSQATRVNIIDELEWLVGNVKENDNVFIYYSGHGEFKKELNKGYWVPVDAKTNSTSQFISNSEIQTFLAGIPSKHTLLVSDACFSGDIFRGTVTSIPFENSEKYYVKVYESKSRQAISSGGIEPVMDGGKDGHSVFAYYMLQALKENPGKYFDATQLFNKIKIPVVNNSEQQPNFNPIKNTGDEGGNFIFIKK